MQFQKLVRLELQELIVPVQVFKEKGAYLFERSDHFNLD